MVRKGITRLGDKVDKLGQRLSKHDTEEIEDEEGDPILMDIALDMEKHPPAQLPSMPGGLNTLQVHWKLSDTNSVACNELIHIIEKFTQIQLSVHSYSACQAASVLWRYTGNSVIET